MDRLIIKLQQKYIYIKTAKRKIIEENSHGKENRQNVLIKIQHLRKLLERMSNYPGNESVLQRLILFAITCKTSEQMQVKY